MARCNFDLARWMPQQVTNNNVIVQLRVRTNLGDHLQYHTAHVTLMRLKPSWAATLRTVQSAGKPASSGEKNTGEVHSSQIRKIIFVFLNTKIQINNQKIILNNNT